MRRRERKKRKSVKYSVPMSQTLEKENGKITDQRQKIGGKTPSHLLNISFLLLCYLPKRGWGKHRDFLLFVRLMVFLIPQSPNPLKWSKMAADGKTNVSVISEYNQLGFLSHRHSLSHSHLSKDKSNRWVQDGTGSSTGLLEQSIWDTTHFCPALISSNFQDPSSPNQPPAISKSVTFTLLSTESECLVIYLLSEIMLILLPYSSYSSRKLPWLT